jgi:uroporphyrinogen decarboxylase
LDIGGSINNLNDGIYRKVKEYLGIEGEIEPYRGLRTSTFYDERVLEALDVDTRHVWLNDPVEYRSLEDPTFNPKDYTDDWGVVIKQVEGKGAFHTEPPLRGKSIDEIERFTWPDTKNPVRIKGLEERVQRLKQENEYAIVANHLATAGLLEWGGFLRGTEQFFMDLLIEKELAHFLLDKINEVFMGLYDLFLSVAGPALDILYWAEDYGSQAGLLVSKEVYREFFKERHARLFRFIKERAPHVKIQFHSCGAVSELIPDLIETGIEIINPLQPLAAGMDPASLKKTYGKRLCFSGSIDIQKALPGTLEEVEQEVKLRINQLGPGGGYIVAPANHIQDNTPPENVVHLSKMTRKYGNYPLSVPVR